MRKIVLLTISAMALLTSCSKENNNNGATEQNEIQTKKRIVQINRNQELYAKIYYTNNLISGIDYFKESKLNYRYKMYYDNKGLMTKKEYYTATDILVSYDVFSFKGKLAVKREDYRQNPQGEFYLRSYATYENREGESNNLISSKYYEEGKLKNYYKIDYIDDLGSSNSTGYDAQGNKTYIATWVKDNKIAFDKYFDAHPYQHEHNNISITHKNLLDDSKSWSYTSVFTYDEQGYPLKSVRTNSNKTVETYEYVWEEIKK